MRRSPRSVLLLALLSAGVAAGGVLAPGGALGTPGALTQDVVVSRTSVGSAGQQADLDSFEPAISAGGRYVAFHSDATNLVAADTNGARDIFVRDRLAGSTLRISVGPAGRQANGDSFGPAMSADGRYVVFTSAASNLIARDTNGALDVFVRDLERGTTRRISVGPDGLEANGDSGNFDGASISAGGRYVAFDSAATNLVGADTNGLGDVFVRDRKLGRTERVSVGPGGVQAQSATGGSGQAEISARGRFVVFSSGADNLVAQEDGLAADIFVRDRKAGVTRLITVGRLGRPTIKPSRDPSISPGGRFVAFTSEASNLVLGDDNRQPDVFVRDRRNAVTTRVSVGPGGVQSDGVSVDAHLFGAGRYVVFASDASNLASGGNVTGTTDVYVFDQVLGVTQRVSVGPGGRLGDGRSFQPAVSSSGRHLAFSSDATNLVAGDTNGVADIFVRDEFGDTGSAARSR